METRSSGRGLAAGLACCALITLVLLANHPAGGGHSLTEVISAEARDRTADALVHGGFVITLTALIVCLMSVARILGTARPIVLTGLVSFCVGSGMLMLSMILDGLAVPAIATRFIGITDPSALLPARTALMLCGILIGILMPFGLLLQAATMLSWSIAIAPRRGLPLAVAIYGLLATALIASGLMLAPAAISGHVLLGAIVLLALWYGALALLVGTRAIAPGSAPLS